MAVEIVFETHSLTVDNETGIATGWMDGRLSERGRALAAELGDRRRDDGIAAVFTSDLGRAVETAEIAFGGTGIPVHRDARLRECDYGEWNGMPVDRLTAERRNHIRTPFPGGQSYLDVVDQMAEFLRDVARDWGGHRVLVIGHTATRWALDHLLTGVALEALVDAPFGWREGWTYTLESTGIDRDARWLPRPRPHEGVDSMPQAVRFDEYGGIDVLRVVEVDRPTPGPGQVLVRVKAAGINPGEAAIREGLMHAMWPATFPSGEGSDLAGVVEEVGDGVDGVAAGDDVVGFTHNRASHAEYVVVEADNLTRRPANVPWEQAGALFVAGTTAYAAVRAVALQPGDVLVVSGAAGGVGSLAVQLARNAGAKVIGLASERNHPWLTEHGVTPVAYGDGVADRIRGVTDHVDAFIDTFGADYVELALELGVQPDRIDTIANYPAVEKYGVKFEGTAAAASAEVLAELVELVSSGRLDVPIAATYPLAEVRDAYRELEKRHTRGKIVLIL